MTNCAGDVPESASCRAQARRPRRWTARRPPRRPGNAPRSPASQPVHGAVDRVADPHPHHRHVDDVGAQHHQAAILEEQRLDADHGGEHQRGRPGPQQDRRQGRAQQVAGRPARHSEIQHLPGEDAGGHRPHHGHLPLAQLPVGPAQRDGHHDAGDSPAEQRHRGREESIRDVHRLRRALARWQTETRTTRAPHYRFRLSNASGGPAEPRCVERGQATHGTGGRCRTPRNGRCAARTRTRAPSFAARN